MKMPLQQRFGHRLAGLIRHPGRDRFGIDGVEVAASRQHVDQSTQRRAGRPGRHVPAIQSVQDRGDLVAGAGEPRYHLLAGEAQSGSNMLVRRSEDAFHDFGTASTDQPDRERDDSCRACASTASTSAIRCVLWKPECGPQPGTPLT